MSDSDSSPPSAPPAPIVDPRIGECIMSYLDHTKSGVLSDVEILQAEEKGLLDCVPRLDREPRDRRLGNSSIDVALDNIIYRQVNPFTQPKRVLVFGKTFSYSPRTVKLVAIPLLVLAILKFFTFWFWAQLGIALIGCVFFKESVEEGIVAQKGETDVRYYFNPSSAASVRSTFAEKPTLASTLADLKKQYLDARMDISKIDFTGIQDHERVFVLKPFERVLARSREKIGGLKNITTQMHARSSAGRAGIHVCACAGQGDIGFADQWTMEIQNVNPYHHVILVCGRRYAQIQFFWAGDTAHLYKGKYNSDTMLPALYADWEIAAEAEEAARLKAKKEGKPLPEEDEEEEDEEEETSS